MKRLSINLLFVMTNDFKFLLYLQYKIISKNIVKKQSNDENPASPAI